MRKRELILAMRRHEKVRAYDPMTQTYGEECVVKRVSYFVRESGKISISAELWGYNGTYHELAKNIRLAREIGKEKETVLGGGRWQNLPLEQL